MDDRVIFLEEKKQRALFLGVDAAADTRLTT
jgi:hypothetical protein